MQRLEVSDKVPFIHKCTDDSKDIYDNDDDGDNDEVDDDDEDLRNVFGEPSTCPSRCVGRGLFSAKITIIMIFIDDDVLY